MSSATSSRDRSVGPLTLVARLWWRSTRGVLVGAAVAAVLGVGTWAAVDRLGDAAQVALRRAAAGGALPAVVVGGLDGAASPLAPELLRAPVRAALARCIGRAQVRHGETGIEVLVLGLELAKEAMARPQRFSGTFAPVSAGRSKLLLDASTAAKLAVAPGDDLVLLGRRRVPVTLVALLDPHGSQRIVQGVAVVELTAAQRAFARDDIDQLELLLAPTADPPAEARRIAAVLPTGAVARPVDRRVADGAAEALQMTWRMGGWIALAFACMALLAAVQELVRASARQRGLLHALGASPGLLRAIALGPSAAFCVFAVAAGLSLGELLAPWLRAGCESWVELQTGVTVRLDAGIRAWPAWLGALALAATFGGLVAQWFAAPRWVVRAGRGAERSVEARRLVFAGVAFAVALACAHTGVVQASRWLRVLDLLAGVAAVAFAAPPMVAILARGFARSGRAAAVLAAARLRHRPDGLVGAARLLAVAAAITIALLCVGGSLEGARADIVRARVPGDVLVTDVPTWLGFAADPAGLHAALLADPAVQSAGGTAHSGWIGVDLRSGNGGRRLVERLPAGALVLDAVATRERLMAASTAALDTIAAVVGLFAASAVFALWLLWWLDERHNRPTARLLETVGAGHREWRCVRRRLALAVGVGGAFVGVPGGILLGHAWTRGPLRSVLGFDCAFAPPAALLVLAPFLVIGTMLAAAVFVGRARVTPW